MYLSLSLCPRAHGPRREAGSIQLGNPVARVALAVCFGTTIGIEKTWMVLRPPSSKPLPPACCADQKKAMWAMLCCHFRIHQIQLQRNLSCQEHESCCLMSSQVKTFLVLDLGPRVMFHDRIRIRLFQCQNGNNGADR